SCKVFFLRTVRKKYTYKCTAKGRCSIKDGFLKCRACRYELCLKSNMDPSIVGSSGARFSMKDELPDLDPIECTSDKEINEQRAVVPYLNKGFLRTTELLSSSYLIGKQFIADLRQRGCSPASLATRLYQLERACDFQNSFMSYGRPVEGAMIELIPLIYTRIALHYLDWVASLLELIEMDEKDRLALVSAQLCQLQFCTIAYNTYREGKEGILFGAGIHFIPPETPPTDEFDSFMVQLSTYLHKEVISLFKEIKISPEEYALMKMICFFSTTAILTQKSVNVVQRARVKYEQLLMEYIVEAYPDLNREERQMRMVKIASANRHFLQLGILDNAYITKMFSLNMANLRKQAIWLAILDGVEVSSDCENVKDSTKKCTGTNKCSHAHLEKKNEQAIIKQLEIRTCATGFLLTNWTTGYQRKEIPGSHLTVTEQACEGDLCNKLPMTELKQRAEEAAKHSPTASYLVLPVVAFFASNIHAFF
ncbi:unnamed protein product, partial [Mesorhabditis spiculigera]